MPVRGVRFYHSVGLVILVPIRTARGGNNREHWRARAARVKVEREAVALFLNGRPKPPIPCVVILKRMAPSNGLDDDNLAGALKSVRDEVAKWIGVDDKDRTRVRYVYQQDRGPWGVQIEFVPIAPAEAFNSLMEAF